MVASQEHLKASGFGGQEQTPERAGGKEAIMTGPVPDLLTLAARLKKIEKQNRWLKFFCLLMLVFWLLGGNLGGTLAAKILSGPRLAAQEGVASPEKPREDLTRLEDIINPEFIKKTFKQVVDGLNRTR